MSSEPTRSSWAIKDEAVLAELISLMDLNLTDTALLKELHPHARTIAPQMARAFYTRLLARSETSEYLLASRWLPCMARSAIGLLIYSQARMIARMPANGFRSA